MAHPKHRISKTRRDKRRTHYKIEAATISKCSTTNELHLRHKAYYVGNDLYYRGKFLVLGKVKKVFKEVEGSEDPNED